MANCNTGCDPKDASKPEQCMLDKHLNRAKQKDAETRQQRPGQR